MSTISTARKVTANFSTDEDRWHAVRNRNPAADEAFVYSVRSTGVYCRPTCPAKLACRDNVRFHATCDDAERAGFRACKRCTPNKASLAQRRAADVAFVCRLIEDADEPPNLASLAESVGMSLYHLHRVFKAHTGLTPRGYAAAQRAVRARNELARCRTITEAIYKSGFSSSGRFYQSAAHVLGMKPGIFRSGGSGIVIRYAIGKCWLGQILVAATGNGVCAILLGDDRDQLTSELNDRFPKARLTRGDAAFAGGLAKVISFLETPTIGLDLPLDIRGTAFQERVWNALRELPAGSTATYSQLAQRIGRPKSARAVAKACAANPLAVAIPCHRAIRSDGSISGYRWGVERKKRLLQREQEHTSRCSLAAPLTAEHASSRRAKRAAVPSGFRGRGD